MICATRLLFTWPGSPGGSEICSPVVPLALEKCYVAASGKGGNCRAVLFRKSTRKKKKKKNGSQIIRNGGKLLVCIAVMLTLRGKQTWVCWDARDWIPREGSCCFAWCNLALLLLLWQRSEKEAAGDNGESTIRHSDNFL